MNYESLDDASIVHFYEDLLVHNKCFMILFLLFCNNVNILINLFFKLIFFFFYYLIKLFLLNELQFSMNCCNCLENNFN